MQFLISQYLSLSPATMSVRITHLLKVMQDGALADILESRHIDFLVLAVLLVDLHLLLKVTFPVLLLTVV